VFGIQEKLSIVGSGAAVYSGIDQFLHGVDQYHSTLVNLIQS
jgi:hypothetical protein